VKILYITEIYPDPKRGLGVWGGGEKQFYEISRRVAKRGHDVAVLTCRFPGQPIEDIIDGVKVRRVGLTREPWTGGARKTLLPILSYILKTATLALRLNPDVVHCNTYFPVYPGEVATRLKGTPLVSTFHDIYGLRGWIESQKSAVWGFFGHLATIIATRIPHSKIISVSPQCKRKLVDLGVPENKITVIPNGVDIKLFDSVRVEKVPHQILYVGRLVNFKHVDWLIEALAHVLREVSDAKLKIVGQGPERGNLESLVRKLSLQDKVTFTGTTPTYEAVARYYNESEVFVLPSTVEGEAIALKEAMTARLPVIAMNVAGSGVLSLVQEGENGFLLEPRRPELIANRLVQLLQDEKLRKEMGETGRKFVEKYDWDIIADHVLEIYREVMGK
jgi:glycosyltransferase involved in cell wall biosynthesis